MREQGPITKVKLRRQKGRVNSISNNSRAQTTTLCKRKETECKIIDFPKSKKRQKMYFIYIYIYIYIYIDETFRPITMRIHKFRRKGSEKRDDWQS